MRRASKPKKTPKALTVAQKIGLLKGQVTRASVLAGHAHNRVAALERAYERLLERVERCTELLDCHDEFVERLTELSAQVTRESSRVGSRHHEVEWAKQRVNALLNTLAPLELRMDKLRADVAQLQAAAPGNVQ